MRDADRKLESSLPEPEQLAKLLEIELMQKRAAWQRTHARNRAFRALAFLFLFAIIAGALVIYFFFITNAPTHREGAAAPSKSSAVEPNR